MAQNEGAEIAWLVMAATTHLTFGFGKERLARLKQETLDNYRQYIGWVEQNAVPRFQASHFLRDQDVVLVGAFRPSAARAALRRVWRVRLPGSGSADSSLHRAVNAVQLEGFVVMLAAAGLADSLGLRQDIPGFAKGQLAADVVILHRDRNGKSVSSEAVIVLDLAKVQHQCGIF